MCLAPSTLAQSKKRKGSNFAIWQPRAQERKTSKTNGRPTAAAKSASAAAPSSRKKGEDLDTSPLYVASNLKNARFKDEAKLKLLKWNFAAPRQEFVDQLNEQGAIQCCPETRGIDMTHDMCFFG